MPRRDVAKALSDTRNKCARNVFDTTGEENALPGICWCVWIAPDWKGVRQGRRRKKPWVNLLDARSIQSVEQNV